MKKALLLVLVCWLLINLFFGCLLMFIDNHNIVKGSNDPIQPPLGGNVTVNGDWNVTDLREYYDCTITLNGNLTIEKGGILLLNNVTLEMNVTFDGEFNISVQDGGTLEIQNGSKITDGVYDIDDFTSLDYQYDFWFLEGSIGRIENSTLEGIGSGSNGIRVMSNNVSFRNNVIRNNSRGIYIIGASINLTNNIFKNNFYGIFLDNSNSIIKNNIVNDYGFSGVYIYLSSPILINNIITNKSEPGGTGINSIGGNPIINNNRVINGSYGITLRSEAMLLDNWIESCGVGINNEVSSATIKNNTIINCDIGVHVYNSQPLLLNNNLTNNNIGIKTYVKGNPNIINSSLTSNTYDIYNRENSHPVLLNTTFNKTKVYFEDSSSSIEVQWFLHVFVNTSFGLPVSDARVTIRGQEGTTLNTVTTNSNGEKNWITCAEYYQKKDSFTNYTPQNITVDETKYNMGIAIPGPIINTTTKLVFTLTNDTIKPSSHVLPEPSLHTRNSGIFIEYYFNDNYGSGVKNVTLYYSFNGSPYIPFGMIDEPPDGEFYFHATVDGIYEFYTVAIDRAGNIEETPIVNDTWLYQDLTPPNSTVEPLPPFQNITIFNITATAIDVNNVTEVSLWYNHNDTNWIEYEIDIEWPWLWEFNTSLTGGNGFYKFYTRAFDTPCPDEGPNHERPPNIHDSETLIDTISPYAPIFDNDNNFWYNKTDPLLKWISPSDASGIAGYSFFIDSQPDEVINTNNISVTIQSLSNGNYTFYIKAKDKAGNWGNIGLYPFGIDIISPSSNVVDLQEYHTNISFSVNWIGNDNYNGSGIKWYSVQYKEESEGLWIDWINQTSNTSAIFHGIWNKTYYFSSRAQDLAGNWESHSYDEFDTFTKIIPPNGWLSGYVFDIDNNFPIPNVTISIEENNWINTDEYGFFNISLPKGSYSLNTNITGYHMFNTTVIIHINQTTIINIYLEEIEKVPFGWLSGYVFDLDNNSPIPNVTITLENNWVKTDDYGFYNISLPNGSYSLSTNFTGYYVYNTTIIIHINQTTEMDIYLIEIEKVLIGWIKGYVYDIRSNTPLSGAIISINGLNSVTTDSNGFYEIFSMEGNHTVEVNKNGYCLYLININIISEGNITRDFYLTNSTDSDNDELPDDWEILYFGNLNQSQYDDSDDDGYNNLEEYQAGTNPIEDDSPKKTDEEQKGIDIQKYWWFILLIIIISIIISIFLIIKRKQKKPLNLDSKSLTNDKTNQSSQLDENSNPDSQKELPPPPPWLK